MIYSSEGKCSGVESARHPSYMQSGLLGSLWGMTASEGG